MTDFDSKKFIRKAVYDSGPGDCILLESQSRDHPSSVISLLAAHPVRTLRSKGGKLIWEEKGKEHRFHGNPWQALREFRKECKAPIFGYLGYDLKNFSVKPPLASDNPELIEASEMYFMEPGTLVHFNEFGISSSHGQSVSDYLKEKGIEPEIAQAPGLEPGITVDEYIRNVEEIKRRIHEGDFYELNYSYPFTSTFSGDPLDLYERMRAINPVPFGAFIRCEDLHVCCSSPERYLKKAGNEIVSEPIKGTAARHRDPAADTLQKESLLNEKNRAENLMIVDLVRHDLSQIAKTGSVEVSRLYDIQSFGTVHQLISTVRAEADDGADPVDILEACFPMGSMTGAPKIAVMKAIEELEVYKRGIYSGAIGYIDQEGDFDFNVVIRTAVIRKGRLVYPVGGAITGDSDPLDEWKETLIKARVLTEALSKRGAARNEVESK
ncbi:anthranilate synthase component I family protein [Rhodohalobacter mucosus]|nr:anthranilate synthase component I family protein [Rhodohalobacter mucosus]